MLRKYVNRKLGQRELHHQLISLKLLKELMIGIINNREPNESIDRTVKAPYSIRRVLKVPPCTLKEIYYRRFLSLHRASKWNRQINLLRRKEKIGIMSTLLQNQLLSARIQHAVSVASGTQEWG